MSANANNDVMRVDWSVPDGLAPIEISWTASAGFDLTGFSYLSLLVANVLTIPDLGDCAPAEPNDPIDFKITLADGVGEASVFPDALIAQDFGFVGIPNDGVECRFFQFPRTLRLPLNAFCQQTALDLGNIQRITLGFGVGDTDPTGAVMLDGLEFTASPLDAEAASMCL